MDRKAGREMAMWSCAPHSRLLFHPVVGCAGRCRSGACRIGLAMGRGSGTA
jgi:hypothetical protein